MTPQDVALAIRTAPTEHAIVAALGAWPHPAGRAVEAALAWEGTETALGVALDLHRESVAGRRYVAALLLIAAPAIALWSPLAALTLATLAAVALVTFHHRAARVERLSRVLLHVALRAIAALPKETTKS